MKDDTKDGKKVKAANARAKSLSPERRAEIAKKAAQSRWDEPILMATHGSAEHPLQIGDISIPCYVLEDGKRVLSLGGMVQALGMSIGSASGRQGDRLYQFATGNNVFPFVSSDMLNRMSKPVRFQAPSGGTPATGYEATILADLCDAVLAARAAGALRSDQLHIAKQCEILVRGFARVGIIALVDEATGYQKERAKDALATILEAFIAKELQPWIRTFPTDFYQEMFRLRGLPFPSTTVRRPQYFGVLTNNVVYDRLAPGVREELQKGVPRNEAGRPTAKYFQKLTQNTGYPKLRELLGSVVTIMKLSNNWNDFMDKLNRLHPKYGETIPLPLDYRLEKDTGKGI